MRRIGPWLLLVAVVVALGIVQRPWRTASLIDYGAFYCGAKVVAAGEDPYRVGPLRACENALPVWEPGDDPAHRFTVPSPLPGVGFLLFLPFALLPYVASHALWLAFGIACSAALLIALERLVALPRAFVYAAALLPLVCVPLDIGQPTIFAILALACGAHLVRAGRERTAGAVMCLAFVQPHLALPALAGAFLWLPRTRASIVAGALAAVAATVAILGRSTALEYVTTVLPMHASVETREHMQFSLTFVLTLLHVPARVALDAGLASYVVLTLVGVVAGRRLARRESDPAYYVLLAPACSVLGGSYVHVQQIAVAIPVGLMLYARRREVGAWAAAIPWLLAFPWLFAALEPYLYLPLFALVATTLALSSGVERMRAIALGAAVVAVGLVATSSHVRLDIPKTEPPAPLAASALTDRSWGEFLDWIEPAPLPETVLWKIPTWIGLVCIVAAATARGRRGSFVPT